MGWGFSGSVRAAPSEKQVNDAALRQLEELTDRYRKLGKEGRYGEAIPRAESACKIVETERSNQPLEIAACFDELAELYENQGEYQKAKVFYGRALDMRTDVLGPDHLGVADSLSGLAKTHLSNGEYDKAEPLIVQALRIRRSAQGAKHPSIAESLTDLADLDKATGEYERALTRYQEALTIYEKSGAAGFDRSEFARSLESLADLHRIRGEYEKAEPRFRRALAIYEKTLGIDHPYVAASHNNLAFLYEDQGRYVEAESRYERALTIYENRLGSEHPHVAAIHNNLGGLYQRQGKYGAAERQYERALAIRERVLEADHPLIAQSLNNLAALDEDLGEYSRAESRYQRALTIWEKLLGAHHPSVATSLNNLAHLYVALGEYEKAESRYQRALAIWEKALGGEHPLVATCLNNLAGLYRLKGQYEKAEPLHVQALAIYEKALGPEHPSVAVTLGHLAVLYFLQGDYWKAQQFFERALAIAEKAWGRDSHHVGAVLGNLALVHWKRREHDLARQLQERALVILDEALGRSHPTVAMTLNNLAVLLLEQGDIARPRRLLQRAADIREKALGANHPDVAQSLHNLGKSYELQGEYQTAETLLRRALEIREKMFGSNHPDTAISLHSLGAIDLVLGRHVAAVVKFWRVLDIEQEQLGRALLFAEEYRRLHYAASMRYSFDFVISAHLQKAPGHLPFAGLALTTLLRRKNSVLDLGAASATGIRRSLSKDAQHTLDELTRTRDLYSALVNSGPRSLSVEAFTDRLTVILQEQHLLWRRVSQLSPAVRVLSRPVVVADVQRALPFDGVLIEHIRYSPSDYPRRPSIPSAPRYAAYLVFPDRIDWVDLGPAEPIEQHIAAFRKALQLEQPIPTDLHDAVMQPVLDRLGDARRLFIAPDAELNLVPFGALYDGERYLVERYDLHYLTTGRDLLRPWDAYGSTTDDTLTVVANPSGASLPGTEQESELLESLFPHVETLRHDAATEANAQRRAQPWLLHLATHGFFEIPEPDPEFQRRIDEYTLSMAPSALPFAPGRLDNPMLHSGLLLAADAPAATSADPDDDHLAPDGRLTAYEISGWDLRGTELVVLSACGTGLGEPRAGEGVLGLRRAFAMAGAQTQVMSLWDVSDATTAKLMEAYYRKLLAGKGRAEAMQEVQLEMLRSGEYHPGDWASFVVVGEWRPLSADKLPTPEGPPPVEPRGCGCQRASVAGDATPGMFLLALLAPLAIRRRGTKRSS